MSIMNVIELTKTYVDLSKGLSINNDHILLVFSSAFDVTARLT